MGISEIRNRINKMAKEMAIMEKKLIEAMTEAIYDSVQENPNKPKRISHRIIVVHFSDLIGNPWNYEYYDWEKSAEVVLEFLVGKPGNKWKQLLQEKIKQSDKNIVCFEKKITNGCYKKEYLIPVNRLFIEKIIQRL